MSPLLGAAVVDHVDRALRDVHATSPIVRRVAVASLEAGVGTSTVAELVARTLSRHRPGRVLFTGHPGDDARFLALPVAAESERAALPEALVGDVRPWHGAWRARTAIDDRAFDASVIDIGALPDAHQALDRLEGAGAICLVSSVDRVRGEVAISLAEALTAHPDGAGAVVAFVNVRRSRSMWPRLVCERSPRASTVFPYDDAIATDQANRVSQATVFAALRLAGDLMTVRRTGVAT